MFWGFSLHMLSFYSETTAAAADAAEDVVTGKSTSSSSNSKPSSLAPLPETLKHMAGAANETLMNVSNNFNRNVFCYIGTSISNIFTYIDFFIIAAW